MFRLRNNGLLEALNLEITHSVSQKDESIVRELKGLVSVSQKDGSIVSEL